jgi:hypothetical protein
MLIWLNDAAPRHGQRRCDGRRGRCRGRNGSMGMHDRDRIKALIAKRFYWPERAPDTGAS